MKKIINSNINDIFKELNTNINGLTTKDVEERNKIYGYNSLSLNKERSMLVKFLLEFINPLTISLILISVLSMLLKNNNNGNFISNNVDSIIIILMAVFSVLLSFIQEYRSSNTIKKLNEMVKVRVDVKRNGKYVELPYNTIVPGDIIMLSAGDMIPADVKIISSNKLYVNQSALNGESFPVLKSEKNDNIVKNLFDDNTLCFMGTSVVGGSCESIVINTGKNTEFGKISKSISKVKMETSFDRGIKKFVYLMIKFILILVIFIFFFNYLLRGNFSESLLFSLAIAVGLTPEMMPMIITINLSKGSRDMAKKKVIIKELSSMQNFGAMDILCTDKTGTLTIDKVELIDHEDFNGKKSEKIFKYAYINSKLQNGLENLLDIAVIKHKNINIDNYKKINEIPFDFDRRVMSVIVKEKDNMLISKGAPEEIFKRCNRYEIDNKIYDLDEETGKKIKCKYDDLSKYGYRSLSIAYKPIEKKDNYDYNDETSLIFLGFIFFLDPIKPKVNDALNKIEDLGVKLKVLSGDNVLVTKKICNDLNINTEKIITGDSIDELNDAELRVEVEECSVFSRLSPLQKERVIKSLQQNEHIVGYMGDGINDAPSLKISDVGISVNNGTDISKETAQIILLEKDLSILADCIKEGRKTFSNAIKYVKMASSSNFGNMLSMSVASIVLPYIPMLPVQILLNNFLYDISQITLPWDNVDNEELLKPRKWDIKFLKKYILYLGPISSLFDFFIFAVMILLFNANEEVFHTGWFISSLLTQILVVNVIRTNKIPFFESSPSKFMLTFSILILLFSLILPITKIGTYFGFVPLSISLILSLFLISILYLFVVYVIKKHIVIDKKY